VFVQATPALRRALRAGHAAAITNATLAVYARADIAVRTQAARLEDFQEM